MVGGAYFPDLTGYIQSVTGRYPQIPNLGKGNLDSQLVIARNAMNEACTGGASVCKWHIVGHSRGGLVMRMLMADPSVQSKHTILSVTQVATPNRGCAICDGTESTPAFKQFLSTFFSSETSQIIEMSQKNMVEFNKKYPIGVSDGVQLCKSRSSPDKYFHSKINVEGKTVHSAAAVGNRFGSTHDEFVTFWSNIVDPTYWGNHVLGAIGATDTNYTAANDGVVAECSAAFGATGREGIVLGATDHNDTVFQLLRMANPKGINFLKAHLSWAYENVK